MNDLCNLLNTASIDYDESKELEHFASLTTFNKQVLIESDERYQRYLQGINYWYINQVSYEYIKDNIVKFLQIKNTNKNMIIKLKLMKYIDKEFLKILENL